MITKIGLSLADETADIGRLTNGRFDKGNKFAKGNPYTKKVAEFRRTIMNSVTDEDVSEIILTLVDKAKNGDTAAAKLVLHYTVGQPQTFESPDTQIPTHVAKILKSTLETEMKANLCALKVAGTPIWPLMLELGKKLNEMTENSDN